ncbi:CCN family member 2b [Archocentrus centrarchus]|uniref:CCN family member 2b n=1 Tax=Archocentrus centrarchus TaxID=63155 RepID=UPI0011EA2C39|nr:CCN family member 2-like [Archocentrus centrarchus]
MSLETWSRFSVLMLISLTVAQDCSQPCACPTDPAPCLLGSSLVMDGCGCCKVCARQLGEPCSLLEPCDHHKELYCDYALHSHTETGICMAQEGQTCDLRGVIYRSGESFQPSCKHHCVCINGEIGCVSLCVSKVRLPSPDCPYPHHIQIPGKCCEEWICHQTPQYQLFQSGIAGSSQIQSLPSSYPTLVLKNTSPLGLPEENPRDNCIIQTTEWSQCSASCGMGVSFRITNNNQHCQLERQTRICTVRPCNSHQEKEIKRGKKCVRTPKAQQWIHFKLSGCSSIRAYKPKFCGVCTDDRCCTPRTTITAEVEFHCPEGDIFTKKMMFIKTCSCHYDCPQDNDIFLASNTRRMIGDYDNSM